MNIDPLSGSLKDMPKWQLVERVVAVLEKHLSPDAEVKHDQRLPELLTGALRQCDVVIYSGSRFRRTVTIVEVQDRGRKVGSQTYDSWLKKCEKLGIQHLICVSVAGFTRPVVADAAKRGEMVRLMTLCEPGEFPPFLKARSIELKHRNVTNRQVEIHTDVSAISDTDAVIDSIASMAFSTKESLFIDHKSSEPFSFDIVIQEMERLEFQQDIETTSISEIEEVRRYRLEFPPNERPLWIISGDHRVPVIGASITDQVVTSDLTLPLAILAYEQRIINGTIAWVAAAIGQSQDKEIAINVIFLPQENDGLQLAIQMQFLA